MGIKFISVTFVVLDVNHRDRSKTFKEHYEMEVKKMRIIINKKE